MQDYYNMLPKYITGGTVESLFKVFSKAELKGLKKFLKGDKDLNNFFKRIYTPEKEGKELSFEELKGVVNKLQDLRRNHPAYQARRKKINEGLARKRKEKEKVAETQEVQKAQEEVQKTKKQYVKPEYGKPKDETIKAVKDILAKQKNKSTKEKVSEAKEKVADTLSSRYNIVKSWINNHPKTILWGAGLGLGTGPGRYVLGNALKFTQTNPENWFGNNETAQTNPGESILTLADGTTIKGTWQNGVFTPATSTEATSSTDVADQQIADIIAGVNASPETPSTGYQTDFNDLFSEDAWE